MLNTKKYYLEFGISMALYIVAVFGSVFFVVFNPDSPWRIWVSILPVLPAMLCTIAVIRGLQRLDELQQRIQLTSFAISFAIVGLTTFTYGFLQNVGFPPISFIWIFPFMIMTWGICTPIVARAYK